MSNVFFSNRKSTGILTQEQLAAIGSVVVESTYCEQLVENLIWRLAKMDAKTGRLFTAGLQLNSRLDMLKDLGRHHITDDATIQRFTQIIGDLKDVNNDRNIIVHGSWDPTTENLLQLMLDGPERHPPAEATKQKLRSEPVKFRADKVEQVAQRIDALTRKLLDFAFASL